MKRSTKQLLSLARQLDELMDKQAEYFVQKRPYLIPGEEHIEVTPEMELELKIEIDTTIGRIKEL